MEKENKIEFDGLLSNMKFIAENGLNSVRHTKRIDKLGGQYNLYEIRKDKRIYRIMFIERNNIIILLNLFKTGNQSKAKKTAENIVKELINENLIDC